MRAALAAILFVTAAAAAPAHPPVRDKVEEISRLIDEEQLPAAEQALAQIEKQLGDVAPIEYLEGRLAFEEGRYDEAVKKLEATGMKDEPGSYLRLAKDTQAAVANHKTVSSEHFIFSYPPGKDAILAPYALETLEKQRQALGEVLGYTPPGKIRVEVVQDADELAKLSTLTVEQINTTGTIAICKFNKLIITSPKAVLRGYDWQSTLAHEFTHLVVTQKGHNQVPIWLQEGFAKYLESLWAGAPGLDLPPASRALLGARVKANKLVTFQQMYPSMALLPSAEDADTAFSEVFFAMDYIFKDKGPPALRQIIDAMARGETDQAAVARALGVSFPQFQKDWLAFLRKQPYPPELLPTNALRPVLKGKGAKEEKDKGKEISFSDFREVTEPKARRYAHLGELLRERNHDAAAAEEYGRARELVGDKYESISNKDALALLASHHLDEAERVLLASLKIHPEIPATQVHLGRIYLAQGAWAKAKTAYLAALAQDPFDPEIHFALTRVGEALGDKALSERARNDAALLTGMSINDVESVVQRFAKQSDLSQAHTTPSQAPAPGQPTAPTHATAPAPAPGPAPTPDHAPSPAPNPKATPPSGEGP